MENWKRLLIIFWQNFWRIWWFSGTSWAFQNPVSGIWFITSWDKKQKMVAYHHLSMLLYKLLGRYFSSSFFSCRQKKILFKNHHACIVSLLRSSFYFFNLITMYGCYGKCNRNVKIPFEYLVKYNFELCQNTIHFSRYFSNDRSTELCNYG